MRQSTSAGPINLGDPRLGPNLDANKPTVMQVIHWKHWKHVKRIPGDVREYIERVWAPKIPKLYEELFEQARNGEPVSEQALDILKTMTLMTPSLTPMGLRERINADAVPGLPSDIDLTHLTTADLARLARKELTIDNVESARKAKHAAKMRAKKGKIRTGEAARTGPHSQQRRKSEAADAGGVHDPAGENNRFSPEHPPQENLEK